MLLRSLIITTAIEHTTFRKTAKMLHEEGVYVKLVGFTRNNYPTDADNLEQEIVGTLSHGNYFKRIVILFKTLFRLRKLVNDFDIIHVFTLDTLIFARLATILKKRVIVYQIQDIRTALAGDSVKAKILRSIESKLLKTVDILVASSPEFITDYFKKHYHKLPSNILVIENKLDENYIIKKNIGKKKPVDNVITVGYFGVLRCFRSWEILKNTTLKSNGRLALYLRGKNTAINNLTELIKSQKNIEFGGPYRSPTDLPELYYNVDIVWAAYPFSYGENGNWQMARTIRFYEACAYKKPVIVQKGTPHEELVLKKNIGMAVDMSDIEKATSDLLSITSNEIEVWKTNLNRLDKSIFIHTDEYRKFAELLKYLVKKRNE